MTDTIAFKSVVCPGCAQVIPIDNQGCTNCGDVWQQGVATSGGSYLIHKFQSQVLSEGTGDRVSLYGSKCGAVATKAIDTDPALLAISSRCKRCFK